jgi:hypothetical protein
MATTDDPPVPPLLPTDRAGRLLESRPLAALAIALLVTGGHSMNLRETGVSQGWVPAEAYAMQSCYMFSLAMTLLAGPTLLRWWSSRALVAVGLAMGAIGGLANGSEIWLSLPSFLAGRTMAGAGAGLAIFFAPRLLGPRWHVAVVWAFILCPAAGPGVVSLATMLAESSDWQHGFLLEGTASGLGLALVLSMGAAAEPESPTPRAHPLMLACLTMASAALMYVTHWGQLQGWLESPDVAAAAGAGLAALTGAAVLAWPHVDWDVPARNWLRLGLFFFGGLCQFLYGYLMNVYGGTIVNLSSWQRALLIWPMPIGTALGLAGFRILARRVPAVPGLPVAVAGLLLLTAGSYDCFLKTMEWPYWVVRDVVDLNWFSAPGAQELASGRFLMGLGIGLFMYAADAAIARPPEEEARVQPFFPFLQFFGGGLAVAILVNFLIIGHKVHYSYSSERDAIQSEELAQRIEMIKGELQRVGQPSPGRSAQVLMNRFIHYEADNLVFATVYATFSLAALVLAGLTAGVLFHRSLQSIRLKRAGPIARAASGPDGRRDPRR